MIDPFTWFIFKMAENFGAKTMPEAITFFIIIIILFIIWGLWSGYNENRLQKYKEDNMTIKEYNQKQLEEEWKKERDRKKKANLPF